MRIGCSSVTLRAEPVDVALERIAAAGFTLTELAAIPVFAPHVDLVDRPDGQGERLAARCRELGLDVAGVNSVAWYPDALDDPDELRRRYTLCADVAVAVGAPVWVIDAGKPEGTGAAATRAEAVDRWKRTAAMAAELADERGLRLAVEAPHRNTLAETVPAAVELAAAAGVPGLGFDYDTSHIFNSGSSVAESLELVGDRILHIALRDANREGTFCAPGDGEFDFAALVAGLAARRYDGDLVLELETPGGLTAEQIMEEAVRARSVMEQLLAGVPA